MREERVLIIGAGASGLVAARALAQARVPVDVIEARGRVGGRILTLHEPSWPIPVELGAEFVHGRPESTLRLLDEAGLVLRQLPDRHHWAFPPLSSSERSSSERSSSEPSSSERTAPLRELHDFWGRMSELLSRVDRDAEDMSAAGFADRERLRPEQRAEFELFVRGFHAAPLADVSVQSLARDVAGAGDGQDAQYRVQGGYGRLIAWLAQQLEATGCRLHLNSPVRRVRWQRGQASVDIGTADEVRRLVGRALIVTVPLPVLAAPASQGLAFEPELTQKRDILGAFGMGQVQKHVLRFRARFWDEAAAPGLEFLHDPGAAFQTFWRETDDGALQVTAWAGDSRAELDPDGAEHATVDRALATLSGLLGVDPARARRALIAHHHHDFARDPFARGAYSFLRPGSRQARSRLAEPIDSTLFFAGEASDAEQPATVAGAIESGARAAREVLGV